MHEVQALKEPGGSSGDRRRYDSYYSDNQIILINTRNISFYIIYIFSRPWELEAE
jgi:hypothetical protein